MIRESSPPDAIFRNGWASRPGLVWAMNSTCSNPAGVAGRDLSPGMVPDEGLRAMENFAFSIPSSASWLSTRGASFFATARRLVLSSSPSRFSSVVSGASCD